MSSRFSRAFLMCTVSLAVACGDGSTTDDKDLSVARGDLSDSRDLSVAGDIDMKSSTDLSAAADMTQVSQIEAVRLAAAAAGTDGGTGVNLPVDDVVVTYVRPQLGLDRAGFFVQAEPTGPALFVGVDPATLTPPPVAGDRVSFVVHSAVTLAGVRTVDVLGGWTRLAQGVDLAPYVQDLSTRADVVSMLDNYESELIKIAGTVAGPFVSAGAPSVAAPINTAGLTGNMDLRLRVPATVRDALDLTQGCSFTLEKGPMGRFGTVAQPSSIVAADITVTSCPAPRPISALALSATSVRITFDRFIDPASVLADGSQFTFDNNLTASAATASGATVTVTTSTQMPRTTYEVVVASTVTDTRGTGVGAAPNNKTTFSGFVTPARLVINEVNPNISNAKDLIELRVVAGGSVKGIRVQQDINSSVLFATLPDVDVATDDIIVVHCDPTEVTTPETTSKGQCTAATCFANAWDFADKDQGITATNRLIVLRNADGTLLDVVPFFATSGTNTSFPLELQAAQAAGMWLPSDCAGMPCTYTSTPTAQSISVLWSGVGNSRAGNSVSRKPVADTNTKDDWNAPGAPSWGLPNP
jgi:hypothetical protein